MRPMPPPAPEISTVLPLRRKALVVISYLRPRQGLWTLVGHAFDLDLTVHHHVALYAGAGRRMFAEIAFIDRVEAPEVARVVEPDPAAHHMFQPVASLLKDGDDILYGQMRLFDNTGADDFAILHGHLARYIKPAAGFHRTSKGQILATGPRLFCTIA